MKLFVLAWQFLTVLPLGPLGRTAHLPSPQDLAKSMVFYPIVGLLLGLLLALTEAVLSGWLSRPLTVLVLIGLLALLTGGLHLDGLADAVDGLGGGHTKEEILAIMRDAHIGAFGVVGLVLLLALRYEALVEMPGQFMSQALMVMPVVGRTAMVVASAAAPYAREEEGLAKPFVEHQSAVLAVVTTGVAVAIAVAFFHFAGLLIVGFLGVGVFGMVAYCRWRCGGITGDILGALNEMTEVLFLIGLPVVMRV